MNIQMGIPLVFQVTAVFGICIYVSSTNVFAHISTNVSLTYLQIVHCPHNQHGIPDLLFSSRYYIWHWLA